MVKMLGLRIWQIRGECWSQCSSILFFNCAKSIFLLYIVRTARYLQYQLYTHATNLQYIFHILHHRVDLLPSVCWTLPYAESMSSSRVLGLYCIEFGVQQTWGEGFDKVTKQCPETLLVPSICRRTKMAEFWSLVPQTSISKAWSMEIGDWME